MEDRDKIKDYVTHQRQEVNQRADQLKEKVSCGNQDGDELQKEDRAHILVVDDNAVDLELLTHILTSHGYNVRSVTSGPMAFKQVALNEPELILLDVILPDMNGYEVCRRLKSNTWSIDIPVIFISALDTHEDRVEGFQVGGVDYITKPFQTAEVLARVETHLTLRRMQKNLELRNSQLQQEIAERKQAERLLQEKEARYRAIVETCDGFIYICSRDYRVEFMNERFIERTGYDGTGEKCYKVIHNRDSICPWCVNDRVFRGETVRWEVQSPKDNIWMYVVNTPLRHADGSLSKQSMIIDITERRKVEEQLQQAHDSLERIVEERTEELLRKNRQLIEEIEERTRIESQLRRSEEKYRHIFENIQDIYYEINLNGIIQEISPSVERITKYTRDELLGKSVYEIYAYPEKRNEFLAIIKETGVVTDYEIAMKDRDDRLLIASLYSRLVFDEDGVPMKIVGSIRDITNRKMAEEALRESEIKYRSIFETTAAATMIIEEDTTISLVNTEFAKLSGYSKEEMEGKRNWTEFITHEDLPRMQEYHRLRRINPNAAPRNYEFRFVSKSRIIRDAFLTIAIIPETKKSVASILDITTRKKAEVAARESEARLRALIDNLPFEFWAMDGNLHYIMQNAASIKAYGDVIGKRIDDLEIPADVIATWIVQDAKVLGGEILHDEEYERIVDGEKKVYNNYLAPVIVDEDIIGIVGAAIDVTARKRAEDALRESEQRLSDIIDFLPDATFAIDREGKIIAWNRAIEEMTGTKAEDMLGKNNYEYSVPFYGFRRSILIDLIFTYDKEIEKEYLFLKKEGDILLAEGNVPLKGGSHTLWAKAGPLYDSKGTIVGAIESIRDITERKRSEKALKKREKQLEVKSRNLEELNTALKVLLKQREVDKEELAERMLSNVKHLVLPYIEKLKRGRLEAKNEAYIGIVESNLKEIVSPFSQRLSSKFMTLTPKELQVAYLIKEGRTTKEIAELLNISPGTIDFHRSNIRDKLNLKNQRANLRSYLLKLS